MAIGCLTEKGGDYAYKRSKELRYPLVKAQQEEEYPDWLAQAALVAAQEKRHRGRRDSINPRHI